MTFLKLLAGAFVAVALTATPALAKGPNALEAYVAKPDSSFTWQVAGLYQGEGYKAAVLNLTSQTWGPKDVDRRVWKHWLTVIIPDKVSHTKAFLYIGGGNNGEAAPTKPAERFAKLAVETSSIVADLADVPNQPLTFADDPAHKARVEDQIIAYLQARFVKSPDPNQLLRLPMVKSGTAAMTAVQEYIATETGGRLKVDGFVVSGASKRGWTTWLVGAVDKRVVGIAPIVINLLDVNATTTHHWRALGYFSPALQDYVDAGLIPGEIGKPGMDAINLVEDPLNYQDRPTMKTIPKYVINAVGDQYFPPDNTRYGYAKVADPKRLRMIPNADHSMAGTDIMDSVTAFQDAVINRRPIPAYSWRVNGEGAIVVKSPAKPTEVRLWQGSNPKARDFRVGVIGRTFTSTVLTAQKDGSYVGNVPKPEAGYTAYFVEMTFPSGGKHPFKFTTEVYVKPDVLPYRWEDARPITKPSSN